MYALSDITVVSGIMVGTMSEDIQSPERRRRRRMLNLHADSLNRLCDLGIRGIVAVANNEELSSHLKGKYPSLNVVDVNLGAWNESAIKNVCLNLVETDLIAFTNADTIVLPQTVKSTLDVIGNKQEFILQGLRWEVSRTITNELLRFGEIPSEDIMHIAQNTAIPHSFPRNATGEWQVTPTAIAKEIGGFDERMVGYGGMDTDFHDRCRAFLLHKHKENMEIVTRSIPILHLYHYTNRVTSPNHSMRHETLVSYCSTSDPKTLDWRNA